MCFSRLQQQLTKQKQIIKKSLFLGWPIEVVLSQCTFISLYRILATYLSVSALSSTKDRWVFTVKHMQWKITAKWKLQEKYLCVYKLQFVTKKQPLYYLFTTELNANYLPTPSFHTYVLLRYHRNKTPDANTYSLYLLQCVLQHCFVVCNLIFQHPFAIESHPPPSPPLFYSGCFFSI